MRRLTGWMLILPRRALPRRRRGMRHTSLVLGASLVRASLVRATLRTHFVRTRLRPRVIRTVLIRLAGASLVRTSLVRASLVRTVLSRTTFVPARHVRVRSSVLRWRRERPESRVRRTPVRWGGTSIGRRGVHARLPGRHGGRMIFAARSPGRNRRAVAEIARPSCGCDRWTSMIHRCEILPVLAGNPLMLGLHRQTPLVALMRRHLFLPGWTRLDPARSAVVADVSRVIHDHGPVINIPDIGDADVGDRAVVIEISPAPFAPDESHAGVAESVIDSAIKSDVRTPVSRVPAVVSVAPSPVAGGPKHADWRHHPRARHPVIAVVIVPGPVARRPVISRAGADGLRINRQRGRPDAYRNAHRDLRERCAGE